MSTRETQQSNWVVYKFSQAEFKTALGIADPEDVLIVHSGSDEVKITLMSTDKA